MDDGKTMRSRITVGIKSWDNLFISFFLVVFTVLCVFPTFSHGESIPEPSRWKIVSVVSTSSSDSDSDKLSLNQEQVSASHLQPKPQPNSNLEFNLSNLDSNLNQARTSQNRFKSKDNLSPVQDEAHEFKRAYNSNPKTKTRPSSTTTATISEDDELRDSDEYSDYDEEDTLDNLKHDDNVDINKDVEKVGNVRNRGKNQPGVSTTTKIPTSISNTDKTGQHDIDIYNEEEEDDEEEETDTEQGQGDIEDEEEEDDDDNDDDMEDEEDENSDNDFRREDLIDVVTELERDAQVEEQSGLLPQVLGLFGQGTMNKKRNNYNNNSSSTSSVIEFEGLDQLKYNSSDEDTSLLPEDLNELSEDIVDDIAAGVEESLLLSDRSGHFGKRNRKANDTEMRQFPMYLFQGQYMPEPRLNRFIDGAIRNMGSELRIDVMDPLYFRVLPRGRVESRPQPAVKFRADLPPSLLKSNINNNNNNNRHENQNTRQSRQNRFFNTLNSLTNKTKKKAPAKTPKKTAGKKRGVVGGRKRRRKNQNRRRKPGVKRQPNNRGVNRNKNNRRKVIRRKPFRRRPGGLGVGGGGVIRRRRPNGNRNRNKNRNPNRNKNRNPNRNKKKRPNKKRPGNKKNKTRQKRRVKKNVGGGRVEGLSSVQRDGDAEMQAFGNYTLVRSHMKMGPVELSMQFRTRRGLRRTGATLPVIRMHTVTRVSMEGSEMIDFLLDRPHPESIKVRGKLFPLAQRIARNIFARLFLPNSFLTSRLREKSALALLSKPKK